MVDPIRWITSTVECRLCGTSHVSVYPSDILDEERQECPDCGHMSCGPKEE